MKVYWHVLFLILDGTIPEQEIRRMIGESYDLIAGARSGSRKQTVKVIANVHGQQGAGKGSACQNREYGVRLL